MWIAIISSTCAIGMFTWTKWRLSAAQELPEADREAWLAGNYVEHKEKQLRMASLVVEESTR